MREREKSIVKQKCGIHYCIAFFISHIKLYYQSLEGVKIVYFFKKSGMFEELLLLYTIRIRSLLFSVCTYLFPAI